MTIEKEQQTDKIQEDTTMTNIKLPKLSTDIFSGVTISEAKAIKAYMKETKPMLDDHVQLMLLKAEREMKIGFINIYELEATYFNNYEMPVIKITAKAIDRTSDKADSIHFVEVFIDDTGCTSDHYFKAAR